MARWKMALLTRRSVSEPVKIGDVMLYLDDCLKAPFPRFGGKRRGRAKFVRDGLRSLRRRNIGEG